MPYLTTEYGNPGSMHSVGRRAKEAVDYAREQAAGFFHCNPEQVIFTSGGSEGNNMVFAGLETELRRRNRTGVVISQIEHDSVWKAAHALCIKPDFDLRICPPNADGEVEVQAIDRNVTFNTGLVSVMFANNETGVVNDIAMIGDLCHRHGALYHADAVQAAGVLPLDVTLYPFVDFMTVSSHKINGPKGVGALYAREPKLLAPLIRGGAEQEFGFRGGTENVAGIVGFGKACELTVNKYTEHLAYLTAQHSQLIFMLKNLAHQAGVELRINGNPSNAVPKTLNICFPGIDAQTLVLMLDADGVCISSGSACRAHEDIPSRVLTAMGLSEEDARSSIRISISHTNTPLEIDMAAGKIIKCVTALKQMHATA